MKKPTLALIAFLLFTAAFGQFKPKGTFVGLEEITAFNTHRDLKYPNHKWYHLSVISFKSDSVFLEQSPVGIYKTDTIFSASDGGFYSYAGTIRISQGRTVADLDLKSCDYCPSQFIRFVAPKIAVDEDSTQHAANNVTSSGDGEIIEDITYKYKILYLEKGKKDNEIIVNKNAYRHHNLF